jgi:hypothetical protein
VSQEESGDMTKTPMPLTLCWFCGKLNHYYWYENEDYAGCWVPDTCPCESEREARKQETKDWEEICQQLEKPQDAQVVH